MFGLFPDNWKERGSGTLSHKTERISQRYGRPVGLRRSSTRGMTLIELMFVMSVLGLLASLGIPKAQGMVEHARVARAIGDIQAIAIEIESYMGVNDSLPSSLADVGRATLLDPWGRP
ncbi:MAG: prepilin-type N-terminal cleavage/methylation domain-containing protein, partial [Gemmatimonadales bacterium]